MNEPKRRSWGSIDAGAQSAPSEADRLDEEIAIAEGKALERQREERGRERLAELQREAQPPPERVSRNGRLKVSQILAAYRQAASKWTRPTRAQVADLLSTPERPVTAKILQRAQAKDDLNIPGWPPPGI